MAVRETDRTIRQSVVDRLIDRNPKGQGDPVVSWSESVREYRAAVLRDVEWILNTRRIAEPASEIYPELRQSVYHFGLPDLTSLSADSPMARRILLRHVEEAIQLFEPRLMSVAVSPAETEDKSRRVRFTIEALLKMDPNPEHIAFDTVLETVSGKFHVSGT
jgi:type VI secretion system protein ImpF